jgi:hypothetical protein
MLIAPPSAAGRGHAAERGHGTGQGHTASAPFGLARRRALRTPSRRRRRRAVTVPLAVALAAAAARLPRWLPDTVTALRMRIFASINGEDVVTLPGEHGDEAFLRVYRHPAADGRSRGAVLSDLFWYWLSPGAEVHQEHIEPGARYDRVARATRAILALPAAEVERRVQGCVTRVLDEHARPGARIVRARDLMMPVWAEFSYELIFGEPCPAHARNLIVANADDVVTALKCCGLRHMDRRNRLTRFLVDRIRAGDVVHDLPDDLTVREQALYLQGVFFNTAVVQSSEAMAHLLMVTAHHPEAQRRLVDDDAYADRFIDETLRLFPLFGIAHRITTADIDIAAHDTLPAGSVVCFNYPEYHHHGVDDPATFDPDRWLWHPRREVNHIPFGVAANRPCPAARVAPVGLRVVLREVVRRYAVASTAAHTRSMPNRGPVVLVDRASPGPAWRVRLLLASLRAQDRWEAVPRSLTQLVLGTYMVWDAQRLGLCRRYFAAHPEAAPAPPEPAPSRA